MDFKESPKAGQDLGRFGQIVQKKIHSPLSPVKKNFQKASSTGVKYVKDPSDHG